MRNGSHEAHVFLALHRLCPDVRRAKAPKSEIFEGFGPYVWRGEAYWTAASFGR